MKNDKTEKMLVSLINTLSNKLKDNHMSRKEITDGYHTFGELYFHRMVLFSIICNQNSDFAWKSKQHHDGTMFDTDSFIVGIETPEGQYTYHYNLKYWDMYNVEELKRAPKYDGHKPSDILRLLSLFD